MARTDWTGQDIHCSPQPETLGHVPMFIVGHLDSCGGILWWLVFVVLGGGLTSGLRESLCRAARARLMLVTAWPVCRVFS